MYSLAKRVKLKKGKGKFKANPVFSDAPVRSTWDINVQTVFSGEIGGH